jgi:dolichyl-phosphate-mannose--protein O-mannosyl transferase
VILTAARRVARSSDGLKWPAQVVFDEVHFGKFVNGYITGRYFFDIHPPLGKLLIALVAYSYGYDGTQPFDHIGEAYHANVNLFALRVAVSRLRRTQYMLCACCRLRE